MTPISERCANVASFQVSAICHAATFLVLALTPWATDYEARQPLTLLAATASEPAQPVILRKMEPTVPVLQPRRQELDPMVNLPLDPLEVTVPFEDMELAAPDRFAAGALAPGANARDLMRPVPLKRSISRSPSGRSSVELAPDDLKNDPYVDVVARFIQYDIGALRGEAGARAQREFNALGEDSIPALVWGLNQSAYLNQSCPVIVIQSKLNAELTKSDDPQYKQYVLAHVGQGIPDSAPYAGRLVSFRRQLQSADLPAAQRAVSAARQRARQSLVRRLGRSPRKLRERLNDADPDVRWAAARLTAVRGLPHVDALAGLLDDADPDVRHEAHEALLRISRGEDYGPLLDADPQDRKEAVEHWRRWWSFAREDLKESIDRHQVKDSAEDTAASILAMAEKLDRDGSSEAAARRYRSIVADYPNAPAARVARQRLASR